VRSRGNPWATGWAVTVLALTALAAGCGGDDDEAQTEPAKAPTTREAAPSKPKPVGGESDKEKVRDAVKAFLDAVAARDGAKACGPLTPEGRGMLGILAPGGPVGGTCEGGVRNIAAGLDSAEAAKLRRARLGKIAISGRNAEARVEGASDAFVLQEVDGDWRLSDPVSGLLPLIGETVGAAP
jgi:hypothetical protein